MSQSLLPGSLWEEVGEGLALGSQDVVVNLVKIVFTGELVQTYNGCLCWWYCVYFGYLKAAPIKPAHLLNLHLEDGLALLVSVGPDEH